MAPPQWMQRNQSVTGNQNMRNLMNPVDFVSNETLMNTRSNPQFQSNLLPKMQKVYGEVPSELPQVAGSNLLPQMMQPPGGMNMQGQPNMMMGLPNLPQFMGNLPPPNMNMGMMPPPGMNMGMMPPPLMQQLPNLPQMQGPPMGNMMQLPPGMPPQIPPNNQGNQNM